MTVSRINLPWAAIAIAAAVCLLSLGYWGGVPTGASEAQYWTQLALLVAIIAGFALAGWHFLLRPMPAGVRKPARHELPVTTRQRIALLLTGGIVSTAIGALWDEQWHRNYGIPFGEDFFWRPHILIYFGFGAAILAGCYALYILNRDLRGSFQQRFRANPLVGLLILNAAFMLYALPADPVWHLIIGDDLTAWSLPHLILLASLVMTQLLAVALHCSTIPVDAWRNVTQLRRSDLLPIVGMAAVSLGQLQILLIDWDSSLMGVTPEMLGLYRPEWLMAANMLAVMAVVGMIATRSLRLVGAATAAGLLALAVRWTVIQLLEAHNLQVVAWLAALLPLVAIDIHAWICARSGQSLTWRGTAMAMILASIPNAVVIRAIYPMEPVGILPYAAAVIAVCVGACWLSDKIASAMGRQPTPAGSDRAAGRAFVAGIQRGTGGLCGHLHPHGHAAGLRCARSFKIPP